jgi:DNA transposition AAA+ family ATPase
MSKLVSVRPTGGVAPIATLDMVAATLERLANRRLGVPGIGVLYGPSGWGKTFSTNTLANENRAYYVQMLSAWRSKDLLQKILAEMGVAHGKETVSKLLDMVNQQLSASRRTLIIDEFDHATESHKLVELTRDIYEGSQGSLLLVGEELLPRKLEAWERFHSRVSTWAPAQKVTVEDAAKLAPIYCPGIGIDDDVLIKLVTLSKGSVRRVVNCLTAIHEHSQLYALDEVSTQVLTGIALPSDRAPERRV